VIETLRIWVGSNYINKSITAIKIQFVRKNVNYFFLDKALIEIFNPIVHEFRENQVEANHRQGLLALCKHQHSRTDSEIEY